MSGPQQLGSASEFEGQGGSFRLAENMGLLGIWTSAGDTTTVDTVRGESDAEPFNVLVVDPGPNSELAPGDEANGIAFNRFIQVSLANSRKSGKAIVGRLALGEAEKGKSAPTIFANPTAAEMKAASDLWTSKTVPF